MNSRPWDRFLTEQDKAHLGGREHDGVGFGEKPAVLLIDIYRGVFGDQREPLLEAIKVLPSSTGPAGWDALPHVQRVVSLARELGIPVVHVTGNPAIPHWSDRKPSVSGKRRDGFDPESVERRRWQYDIMPHVAPIPGEPVFLKSSPSGFWNTPLATFLNHFKIDTLITCGESTSGCVRASVVDGCTFGFRMIVVEEGVWDRHEACHAINLFDMNQKYADVVSVEDAIEYLQEWGMRQGTPARKPAGVAR